MLIGFDTASFLKVGPKLKSSSLQMFFKISLLKNFANFTGKHLGVSFYKVAGLRIRTEFGEILHIQSECGGLQLYQKENTTQVFSNGIYEIFENTSSTEHRRWLLLLITGAEV